MGKVQLNFLHLSSSGGTQRIVIHHNSNSSSPSRLDDWSRAPFTIQTFTGEVLGGQRESSALWTTCRVRNSLCRLAIQTPGVCSPVVIPVSHGLYWCQISGACNTSLAFSVSLRKTNVTMSWFAPYVVAID